MRDFFAMSTDPEIDQILAEQQRQRNRRRLRWLVYIVAAIVGIIVLAFLSEPFLRRTRNQGREASAIGALRAISSAQVVFNIGCQGYYATRLTQLGQSGDGGLPPLSADLSFADSVERMGYRIWIDTEPEADSPPCNGVPAGQVARSFVVRAEPLPGEGETFFAMSSEGAEIYSSAQSVRFSKGIATPPATPLR
jgi:hypothetical protein